MAKALTVELKMQSKIAQHLATSRARQAEVQARTRIGARGQKKPVVILPGLGNSSGDYLHLAELLKSRYGCDVEITEVSRIDWFRNIAGLTDVRYWQGCLPPRPTVNWYLNKIEGAVATIKERNPDANLSLLSHSAGGWLGRVFMHDFGTEGIDRFVSLGSPHLAPPKDVPGTVDQTRGILTYCEEKFPGCHHPNVQYATVAGKFVEGAKWGDEGTFQQKFVGAGYKQVLHHKSNDKSTTS